MLNSILNNNNEGEPIEDSTVLNHENLTEESTILNNNNEEEEIHISADIENEEEEV